MRRPLLPRIVRTSLRTARAVVDRANGVRVDPADAVFVGGFWRSGTTWVQESLARAMGAKTCFEPFMDTARHIQRCLGEMGFEGSSPEIVRVLMPCADARAPVPFDQRPRLERLVERALRGQLPYRHADPRWNNRRTFEECLRRRVVVKAVRGALLFAAVRRRFGARLLHVHRDPRAVVASITTLDRGHWADGAFRDLPLVRLLLEGEDGRGELLSPWGDAIRRIDREGSPLAKVAAYHAATESAVRSQLATLDAGWAIVAYEDLVLQPSDTVAALARRLDLPELTAEAFSRAPSTTDWGVWQGLHDAGAASRLVSWQQKLDADAQKTIEAVVADFGRESDLRDIAPRGGLPSGKR